MGAAEATKELNKIVYGRKPPLEAAPWYALKGTPQILTAYYI